MTETYYNKATRALSPEEERKEREKEQERQAARDEEYQRLKDDYAKLQSEFNEWIELLEQDQG